MKFSSVPVDFLRVAVIAPELRVADVAFNVARLGAGLREAGRRGAGVALFPELSVTGYSCGDLFAQALLQERARAALLELAGVTKAAGVPAVVGLPLAVHGRLYNCAA